MLRVHALEGVRDADAVSHEAEVVAGAGRQGCAGSVLPLLWRRVK